ncbi:hypothetical protein A2801_03010 [Candidatus Woesebacteria bacterium RIFCSPHIGHO2_01_FULL_41_10]|uniref:Uncharacterized protein n=1 Tax=Candidatus Woesebacteria bacterium RIFCSPHIGHO2_01_FULL_41_10 TaxID=1802500 RepID=A0A1F7YNK1_9BACT|nr:MAG: hypothetical protein A2801_03010 [Candidatus Woesebacteria bacterium RIFCSPHIGHO2_01_FULL_41_10]
MKKLFIGIGVVFVVLVIGILFVNKQVTSPLPVPSENPEDSVLKPNYTDPDFGYTLYIPKGMIIEKQSIYSTLFYPKDQSQSQGPANFIYISVVTPDMRDSVGEVYNYNPSDFEKLTGLEALGDSVNLAFDDNPDLGQWFTYTIADEVNIDTGRVKIFENTKPWEFPAGTTENRFIYGTAENIYILGYYTGGDSGATIDPREAYQSILSFKVKSTNAPYQTTLSGEYVCLPHKDTSGPQTMECAFGIKTPDGTHYAVDFGENGDLTQFVAGESVTLSGLVTPIEYISTDHWQIYDIVGIFSVTK